MEEFLLSQQNDDQRRSTINRSTPSPHVSPFTSDHVHVQNRNLNDNTIYSEQIKQLGDTFSRSDIYKSGDAEIPYNSIHSRDACVHTSYQIVGSDSFVPFESKENRSVSDKFDKCVTIGTQSGDSSKKRIRNSFNVVQTRRAQEFANTHQTTKHDDSIHSRCGINRNQNSPSHSGRDVLGYKHNVSFNHDVCPIPGYLPPRDFTLEDFKPVAKRFTRNDGIITVSNNL